MLSRQKKLPEEELMLVRNLLGALEPFFQLKGTLPPRCIQAFLLVAEEEGLSVNEYARRANMSMSTMSRNLLDIGERNPHMEKGFGLVPGQAGHRARELR